LKLLVDYEFLFKLSCHIFSDSISVSVSTFVNATLASPSGITLSNDGNFAVIADNTTHILYLVQLSTQQLTVLAGSTCGVQNGLGTNSKFCNPQGLAIAPDDSFVLVAEYFYSLIRRVTLPEGDVSILAGNGIGDTLGIGTNAKFKYPSSIAIHPQGLYALVVDLKNHKIKRLEISTATVSLFAGSPSSQSGVTNGIGTLATFNYPRGIAISKSGTFAIVIGVHIGESRKIILSNVSVSLLSSATDTYHMDTLAVAIDPTDSFVVISEGCRLRKVFLNTPAVIVTLAGSSICGYTDGVGTVSSFSNVSGIAFHPTIEGAILLNDASNHAIRAAMIMEYSVSPTG
jgi:DNA-binding beta-propeller fold protein YncE